MDSQINVIDEKLDQNHLQFNGSIIYDERIKMLENADFGSYRLIRHELLTDGLFGFDFYNPSRTFFYEGQLYYFLTTQLGQISDFFKMNMSKEECLNGKYGVFYSVVFATTKNA